MADTPTIVEQETAAAPVEPESAALAAPIDPSAPDAGEPGPSDDIERALAEYDRALAGPTADEILAPHDEATHQDHLHSAAEALNAQDQLAQLRQGGELAQRRADLLEQALAEHRHVEWLRSENEAFDRLIAETDRELAEFNLPEGFARDWFLSGSLRDPALRAAWDNRAINPRAWDNMQRQCSVALYKLASSRPDPELTADRWMVAQAVRGASRFEPVEQPPVLGSLSDTEYRAYVRHRFGYDPL